MPTVPKFTREQFIATSARAKKLLNWTAVAWLAWFIGVMAIISALLPPELRTKPVFEDFRLALGAIGHFGLSLALLLWG